MQGMRDMMRGSLARSLRTLSPEDRLAAALPLVCGTALAAHCEVLELTSEGTLHLRVRGHEWLASLLAMQEMLRSDLGRVSGVQLSDLHFLVAQLAPAAQVAPAAREPNLLPGRRVAPQNTYQTRRSFPPL